MKKLTFETDFEIYTAEFKNVDVTLDQLFTAFMGQLVASTWLEETIREYIKELADGYSNEDDNN